MSTVRAIVSDFGGVLTSPLLDSFVAYQERTGISVQAFGEAMAAITDRGDPNPLFELESGRITETAFLAALERELRTVIGREVSLDGFGEDYFEHIRPNEPVIELMRSLKRRGYRMAICTNNVREWEPLWRAKLPVDELFEVVVDSGFVGFRKPDHRIYEMTLERLGVGPSETLLLDDLEVNCTAAQALGMQAVWFQSTDQAIADVEAALAT